MSSNVYVINPNQISRSGIPHQVLKNGSSVLVRIIEDKGNGKYTGSVAGVRVNLSSSKPYSVGSSFTAKISVADGKIFVTPESKSTYNLQPMEITVLQNEQAVNFIKNLGLPADYISLNLFQQLKQMELKFDESLLKKIHSLAVRFKGKEKAASELLMMNEEKKIHLNEQELQTLLNLLYDNSWDYEENQFLDKSVLNRFNKAEGAWYIFPFEMLEIKNRKIIGNGFIRTLFSKNNALKLLNIECFYSNRRFLFSISVDKGRCSKIKFNISDLNVDVQKEKVLDLNQRFSKMTDGILTEWAEIHEIEGNACETENLWSFNGSV